MKHCNISTSASVSPLSALEEFMRINGIGAKPTPQPVQATISQTATAALSTPANDATHPAIDPDVVVIDTPTVSARNFYTDWQAAAGSADPAEAKRVLGQSILDAKASAQAAGNVELVGKIDGMIATIEAAEQAAKPPTADVTPKVYDSLEDMLNSGTTVQFGDSPTHDVNTLRMTDRSQQVIDKPQPAEKAAAPKKAAKEPTSGSSAKTKIDDESKEILRYISEDFVMLTRASSVVAYHVESGDELGKDGFKQYCDKHYGEIVLIDEKDGQQTQTRAASGDIWWAWKDPMRRVVRRIVMEPTSKPESDDNPEVFNRWHVLKGTMAEPDYHATTDDIGILFRHLMYLSGGDAVGVMFFLNWLAQLYQTPEIKMPTAVLLYSKAGRVGKNLMQRLLTKVFGKPLVGGCTGKQLQKNFDDAIEHKRLVFINEIARSEKADGYENFKSQVSEEFTQFEGKGRASKEIRNIAHYIVTTNHEDALPLMEGDGRIAVLRCLEPRKDDAYYDELVAWIDGPGAPALANVLATWRFPAGWKPHAPVPQTAAAKAMQAAARDELEVLLAELVEAGAEPCDKDIIFVAELCAKLNTLYGNSLRRSANLTSAGRALKAIGAELCEKRIESPDGKTPKRKFYLLRNKEQWANATPKQRADHMKTGKRLFTVQQPDDRMKTEGECHE